MKPHKHAELIKAWANGATIQTRFGVENQWTDWVISSSPHWHESQQYRIKPEPKADEISYLIFGEALLGWCEFLTGAFFDNAEEKIKVIRDGETGKIKHVELMQ